jgi:hypothetical protein
MKRQYNILYFIDISNGNSGMLLRSLLCLIAAASLVSAQPLNERYQHVGSMYTPQFSSAPFPHPVRSAGHTYGGKTFPAGTHYSDSTVAIFVPNGFRPDKKTDLVIYFHGWYNNIDSACAQFSLIEQFCESSRNAIFVFPEGPKDAPDSFGGRMESTGALTALVNDVLTYLTGKKVIRAATPGRIVLAGHSGAFRVLAFMLNRGGLTKNITDVILFDALYGQTEKYSHWIEQRNGRFVNIYTDDGGTKNESKSLMEDLDAWKVPYSAVEETLMTADHLTNSKALFIHSDLTHNGVIAGRRQFREFLRTSALTAIEPRRRK